MLRRVEENAQWTRRLLSAVEQGRVLAHNILKHGCDLSKHISPPIHVALKQLAPLDYSPSVAYWHSWLPFNLSSVTQDMQDKSPENKPVCRRAALVVGQWVSKLSAQERPSVYRALLGLMADDDFAIALAGVTALHELVSDWDFTEQQFLEFVGPCLEQLATILHAAAQYETQIQVAFPT